MNSDIRAQKSALRVELRERRRNISRQRRREYDAAINRNLLAWTRRTLPRQIAAFWAFDGEPDLNDALASIHETGTAVLLPVISHGRNTGRDSTMTFSRWTPGEPMRDNEFGISEPGGATVALADQDQIFVPLVGWTLRGDRLGMGGGFYDRALAAIARRTQILRIGIAYACQELQDIPVEAWDIPLDGIITEAGHLRFDRPS